MEYPFSSRPLPSLEENVEGCRGICAGIGTVLAEDAYATFAQEKQMNPRKEIWQKKPRQEKRNYLPQKVMISKRRDAIKHPSRDKISTKTKEFRQNLLCYKNHRWAVQTSLQSAIPPWNRYRRK